MNAQNIKKVLLQRHVDDFIAFEVRTGASWSGSGYSILDAFAMRRSWRKPLSIGYEIKVKRGDFLKDDKWMSYLPFCNQFYFVCPTGLIEKKEVGDQCGLIHIKKSTRVVVKAPYRQTKPEDELQIYKHIIMSKMKSDRYPFHSNKAEFYRDWLNNKIAMKDLGWQMKTKMMREIVELERKVDNAKYHEDRFAYLQKIMDEFDVDKWNLKEALKSKTGISTAEIRLLTDIQSNVNNLVRRLAAKEKINE